MSNDVPSAADSGSALTDLLGVIQPTAYQRRVMEQGRKWVAGESFHNDVDDECCPDFSCCNPDLFERDRATRLTEFNNWARRYGLPQIVDA